MMDILILQLQNVIAQAHGKLHAVTILGAKAALNVALKYQRLNDECELYDMSIGEFRTWSSKAGMKLISHLSPLP